MTRDEAIEFSCSTLALAYHSIGDYGRACDGFCNKCVSRVGQSWHYQNDGTALRYVREAVLMRLKKDGHKIAEGFDQKTGDELKT